MQADNRAILNCGGFPLNVVTALTLQTPSGALTLDVCQPGMARRHLNALLQAYPVRAIKTGMLGSGSIVRTLAEALSPYREIPLVVDPVLRSSSGHPLLDEDGIRELKSTLIPITDLLTPNLPELAQLSGRDPVLSGTEERAAAQQLLQTGCAAVLVKGGHRPGNGATDRLYTNDGELEFPGPRVHSPNTRGTGCSLASAIAARVAIGDDFSAAIRRAKSMIQNSLERRQNLLWSGPGPAF